MGNSGGEAVTMIGNELQRLGFPGLGNGRSQSMIANPFLGLPGRRRTPLRTASPSDWSSATGPYEAARRNFEIATYALSRHTRPEEVATFGRDPLPPFTAAHHGSQTGAPRPGELTIPGHDLLPPATVAHHGSQTGASAYRARLTGPAQFLHKLLDTWHLDHRAALALLGLEESQQPYLFDLLNGLSPLEGRDIKDRIAHLFKIRKTLSALFRDETVENEWLREPHLLLDDREPMTLMLEGSMENLLLVKEYVETAAGL